VGVKAQDVATGVPHGLEQHAGASSKMDNRGAGSNSIDHPPCVGKHKLAVVSGAQAADPSVKDLDSLNPGGAYRGRLDDEPRALASSALVSLKSGISSRRQVRMLDASVPASSHLVFAPGATDQTSAPREAPRRETQTYCRSQCSPRQIFQRRLFHALFYA
jgi:hypothetical protein